MTVHLRYLLVEQFQWLFDAVQYASSELRTDALSTVRYAEFCLPSCRYGCDEKNYIGKRFVPFLSKYMPHLQTLCVWREDDFPWTSIRPHQGHGRAYATLLSRWYKSLKTTESIAQHTAMFEQDLCQLVEQLEEFNFLDIYGRTYDKKVQPYHLMAQTRFPNSRIYVDTSRFRLWL
ncbi:unnamed protein product [Rotaria magnacalcarata]|uniref:Uncharacterized protein n=3 Tax=Rotaria magnacalcarata TaxID=392030 RepID=A0A816ACJ0_9BILA|nr:unnamed protein product [Rotaria magnacalcarata]